VTLGSPASEAGRIDNEVQHARTIAAFAIGRTEVTVGQYRRCVDEGGCRPPEWLEPGGEQNIETGRGLYYKNLGASVTSPDAPIVGVSHVDAVAFADWLSKKTGKRYRLPSEAEWEYAARAGTTTAYWWGDAPDAPDGSGRANCRGCGKAERKLVPDPVESFAANAWGLFNVHGNVWEWTADYYCGDQSSGPADGSARTADDCPVRDAAGLRVLRGGSAFYGPEKMRSASRLRNFPGFRNFSVGFRIARDL
jgi:formylglycine-generating enzyme required for sulfatase activity